MQKITTPRKIYSKDKWSCSEVTIKPERRHVGMYYWCDYWRQWDKVLAVNVDGYKVRVVACDMQGNPLEEPREHCTGMSPAMFADRPFNPTTY